jgi:hypothetical protein
MERQEAERQKVLIKAEEVVPLEESKEMHKAKKKLKKEIKKQKKREKRERKRARRSPTPSKSTTIYSQHNIGPKNTTRRLSFANLLWRTV